MNVTRSAHRLRGAAAAVAALAAAIAAAPLVSTQGTNRDLVLRGATIYSAPDAAPIRDGIVVVRAGTIAAVGSRAEVVPPADLPVLDLSNLTLVAGFWNSHVHFDEALFGQADSAPSAQLSAATRDMLTAWGFTSVVDTGSPLKNTLALRRRIESGDVDGPRIFTTGDILFPPGARKGALQIGTPIQARTAVNALLDGGADAIKVYAQTFWDLTLKLSPEVLATVRTETRRRGVQMVAHPSNRDGLNNAVDAGVDVLVHTTPQIGPWGPALVARMRAARIALIPTLTLWRFELQRDKVPPAAIEAFQRRGIEQLREYFSAGGTILFGTDVGYMTDFGTLEEFQKMTEAGMTFRDLLASLTTAPAAQRGVSGTSGRIAVGYDADFVVLGADPAHSVNAFADVAYAIRGGRVIFRRPAQK